MERPSTEKALKVRSLLASYYDAGEDEFNHPTSSTPGGGSYLSPARSASSTPASSARTTIENDPSRSLSAIDSTYFDPDAYLRRLVRDTRLGSLVEHHRLIAAEVASLDSDMQTLVYENYNKFIGATDIIRTMDGAMEGLGERLSKLEGLIGGAVQRSESVNGTLEQRQAVIMELKHTRELLQKLQVVLALPRKLKAALAQGAFDVAAESYAQAAPLLQRHGQRKALRKVGAEVETCRAELAAKLRAQLLARPDDAAETIQLIAKLREPTASLIQDFLGCQRRRLHAAFAAGEVALARAGVKGQGLQAAVAALNESFLAELIRTADLFSQLFDASARPQLVAEAREWFSKYVAAVRSAVEATAGAKTSAAVGLDAAGNAVDSSLNAEISSDWGAPELARTLQVLSSDLPLLQDSLPELCSRDAATELVQSAVKHHVVASFAALEARLAVQLAEVRTSMAGCIGDEAEARRRASRAITELPGFAVRGMQRAVGGIAQWGAHRWALEEWRDGFSALVQGQAAEWMRGIPRRCQAAAGLPPSKSSSSGSLSSFSPGKATRAAMAGVAPVFLLALSAVCSSVELRLAPTAETLLRQTLGTSNGGSSTAWSAAPKQAAAAAADRLLKAYTAALGAELQDLMRSAVESTAWGSHVEVRTPQQVCMELIDHLACMDADMAAIENEAQAGTAPAGAVDTHHSRQSTGGSFSSLESAAAAAASILMAPPSGVAWASRADVVAAVASDALQAEAEALRQHTLSRTSFQQVQLDCHFLRSALQRLVESTSAGRTALAAIDEVMVVSAERCGEPVMLEPMALDKMVAAATAGGGHFNRPTSRTF